MNDAQAVEQLWSQVFGVTTPIGETTKVSLPGAAGAAAATGAAKNGRVEGTLSLHETSLARHSLQTRAIALNLAGVGLLRPPPEGGLTTIEFGAAADATLSETVRVEVPERAQSRLRQILIDRDASSAHSTHDHVDPVDTGHLDGPKSGVVRRERFTIDIAELDLPAVVGPVAPKDIVVGMAKHLCGAACDMALREILSVAEIHSGQLGVAIVSCCYGGCKWNSCCKATQNFFDSHGVDVGRFRLICNAASNMATICHRITAAATAAASAG